LFDVKLYTGNGSARSLTTGFSPDLVWVKARNDAYGHRLLDTVRGATKPLVSSSTSAEITESDGLTAFNSDGFSLGTDIVYNQSSYSYVAWCWDAGSSTVTNTQGSISSQVRANASAGFSIVTWTNPSTANQTIGHGLGVAPAMIIRKYRSNADGWAVYHSSLGQANALVLNSTGAALADANFWPGTINSTVFSTGNLGYFPDGWTAVAYCFAPVAGYSSFGSYTGNGSADGPFVYTGFRPRWIMIKRTDSTSSWAILDATRLGYNVRNDSLYANLADAEANFGLIDILSNGFKLRATFASENGGTHIYAAFAEHPFQYARAR
jgi:hypothetical protein